MLYVLFLERHYRNAEYKKNEIPKKVSTVFKTTSFLLKRCFFASSFLRVAFAVSNYSCSLRSMKKL